MAYLIFWLDEKLSLVQTSTMISLSTSFLIDPRTVDAWQIPDVVGGRFSPIRLLRVEETDCQTIEDHGGYLSNGSWWMDRRDSFPFEAIDHHLPRSALRSLVPELVDLIPSSSWFASLANLLSPSSWNELKAPYLSYQKGCQDCGHGNRLEAHEAWSYDEVNAIQTLDGIIILCRFCHDTRHLGRARLMGKFDDVFRRLCKINRIGVRERNLFFDVISENWERRSLQSWQLNIPLGFDTMVYLKPSIVHAGDGWLVMPATDRRKEMVTRIINVGIGTHRGKLVLVGLSESEIRAAYEMPIF